jgi:uncharacterized protein YecE (DUF72 family)
MRAYAPDVFSGAFSVGPASVPAGRDAGPTEHFKLIDHGTATLLVNSMEVWIGTSGYAYPGWTGVFYPAGASSTRMLSYYVTQFPLVELNYTFYRMPTADELVKLAGRTPHGFKFIIKLHQSLSHENKLESAAAFREAVKPLQEDGRMLGLLCQYPQRFHQTPDNRGRLEALAERFAGHDLAVEFRHHSWGGAEVREWLRRLGVHLVSVDAPAIPALYPSGLVQSTPLCYVRFHSRRASSWYASDKERYDYLYTDDELRAWIDALTAKATDTKRAFVLFNNCERGQAALNARRMMALFAGEKSISLVPPFAQPGKQQPLLF